MQILTERAALIDIVTRAASIVEVKKSVPILGHVVLATGENSVSVTATDLDIDITDSCPADVARSGAITVPALMLADIVRKTSGAEISFNSMPENGTVEIRSGKAKFRLPTLAAEDFPNVHELGVVKCTFEMALADLLDIFQSVKHAMSTEHTRHYLRGVYLHGHASTRLRAVATNGHVLAMREMPAPIGAGNLDGVLLPLKLVNSFAKIASDTSAETMVVSVSGVRVQFRIGTMTLTSKLIDGTYPDYQRVIPSSHVTRMIVNAKDMASAVDRVGAVALTGIGLHVNSALSITGRGTDGGTADDQIDAEHTGPDVSIGFNASYVSQTLGIVDGDAIWEFTDAGSPAVVKDSADDTKLFVLMPMRL